MIELLEKAASWLAERGSDQWQDMSDRRRQKVLQDIDGETLYLVEDGAGGAVATITLDDQADTDFWQRSDDVRSAVYVHRMAVSRNLAGHHLGSAMLDWAGGQARILGKPLVRLDAWRTNLDLRSYYLGQGFHLVRVCQAAERGSGALFQRPAGMQLGLGPALTTL